MDKNKARAVVWVHHGTAYALVVNFIAVNRVIISPQGTPPKLRKGPLRGVIL
jgi:hypothetical protein